MNPDYSGLVFAALCALLFLPAAVQRHRRRKAARIAAARRHEWADTMREAELRRVVDQRDRYAALYHGAVKRNAALLEHITDEREAAAVQALADSPAYFAAKAARETKRLDVELFDLLSEEGEQ